MALKAAEQIAYRQSVMSIIGTHMGAIGDLISTRARRARRDRDPREADGGERSTHRPPSARGSPKARPAAKPEIWTDWTKFQTEIAEYEEAANALASAAASGDPAKIGPAMKALGGSCGGCHKPFRKPKEESYKNK
ncbi:MAG: cytochrome c [Myxococcota bacterium]